MKDDTVQSESPAQRELPPERILRLAGIAAPILCVLGGIIQLIIAWRDPAEGMAAGINMLVAFLAVGVALWGLMFGLSIVVKNTNAMHAALIRLEKYQYEIGPSAGTGTAAKQSESLDVPVGEGTLSMFDPATGTTEGAQVAPPWQELVGLLQQMRDNSLLSDEERTLKRQHAEDSEYAQAMEVIEALKGEGDFVRARQVVETFRSKYPASQRAQQLYQEHERNRERYESQDVHTITRQVEDLMSISAWPRARQVVQHLVERHPDSAESRQLLLRVEKEYTVFQAEQRRRMYAEVQRFVTQKRWEQAMVAAKTFVERFPGCSESEALLMQIPTLQNNAEIELRQEFEAKIMDFVRHGRYIEAVELARRLIEKYPGSPQAEALRNQLPRLEELANNPDARPARVRVD